MDQIKTYLESIAPLSEPEWLLFSSKLQHRTYEKGAVLHAAGSIENQLSFLKRGIVRFHFPHEEAEDRDFTFAFAFEGVFFSAYDSFLTQSVSQYSISAVTPSQVWQISFQDLQAIYQMTQIGNTIGRIVAEELYIAKMKREMTLLRDTAKERYLALLKECPQLIQHIPLKYLAPYIGITPQSLSRIRREIS